MTRMKGGYLQAFGTSSSNLDSLTKYVLKDSSSQSQTAIELDPNIDLSYIGFEKLLRIVGFLRIIMKLPCPIH